MARQLSIVNTSRPTTDELEAIWGRKVDLIDRRAVEERQNYIRRQNILQSAEVIYAT